MLVENTSGVAGLAFEQLHRDGQMMAVAVARGRWQIFPDGSLQTVPTKIVLADVFEGDPHKNDLLIPGDLVPYKPSADITLLGIAHALEPQERVAAEIAVGGHVAALRGCGPREWVHGRSGWVLTDPPKVGQVPLSYRLASGGGVSGTLCI